MPHIGDRLDAKGISWKWYSGGYDDAMAGHPDAGSSSIISHCNTSRTWHPGRRRRRRICRTIRTWYATSQQNTLPQVVFYKPIGQFNQHPGYANVTDGDRHLAELVTKLQHSLAYRDMLILIT